MPGDLTVADAGMRERRAPHRLVAAVIWTILIMVLCWMPGDLVREVEGESSWFEIPHLDKVVHGPIFAIFSILWLRVRPARRPIGLVLCAGWLLAVVTEVVQSLPIIGRDTSAADMLTDGIGAVIGIAVAPLVEPLARSLEARFFRKAAVPAPQQERATAPAEPRS
jgi:hypothetical protein